jgi:hypothetical protein
VTWPQFVSGWVLVGLLLALAVGIGWRQVRALQALREDPDPSSDDARYERGKARRRLVNSALTLLLAGLLAGAMVFLEVPADRLAGARDAAEPGEGLTPEEKQFALRYAWYWILLLLVLFAVLAVAAVDLFATRRYALRQYRKLQADRRQMIERQTARLRQERNGQG